VQDTRGPDGTQTREAEGACDPTARARSRFRVRAFMNEKERAERERAVSPHCSTLLETTCISRISLRRGPFRLARHTRNRGSRFADLDSRRRDSVRTESESRRSLFGGRTHRDRIIRDLNGVRKRLIPFIR